MSEMRRRLQRLDSERGSLMIAMSVLLVAGVMGAALLARTTAGLTSVRRSQDFSTSLAAADGGIADALAAIRSGPATSTLSGTSTLGDSEFRWGAVLEPDGSWRVQSIGTTNGVPHAVEARLSRPAAYGYVLFADQGISIRGVSASFTSTDGSGPVAGRAWIGSNGAISVSTSTGGDEQHHYTPGGSCSGCSNPISMPGPRVLEAPPAPTSSQSCPSGGSFGPVIDGRNGLAFRCERDISFSAGTVTVTNPPAVIWVGPDHHVTMDRSDLNPGGSAADLQIQKAGTGDLDVGNGANAATMVGIIDAPDTALTVSGGHFRFTGALVVDELRLNGAPRLDLTFDTRVTNVAAGSWQVRDWREMPVADVTLV